MNAYEALQPYCVCGRALMRPDGMVMPSTLGVLVRCECGRRILAQFWRQQRDVLLVHPWGAEP